MSVNLVETNGIRSPKKLSGSVRFSLHSVAKILLFIRNVPNPQTRESGNVCHEVGFLVRWLASPPLFYHPSIEETLIALFYPLIRIFEIVKIIMCFMNF